MGAPDGPAAGRLPAVPVRSAGGRQSQVVREVGAATISF